MAFTHEVHTKRSDHDYFGETELCSYCSKIWNTKKYPAQMLEVAGDLRRAPAKFENPEHWTCDL